MHALKWLSLCRVFVSVPHFYTDAFAIPKLIQKYPEDLLKKVRILSYTVFNYLSPQTHPLLKSVKTHTNKVF